MKTVINLVNFLIKRREVLAHMKHLETQEIVDGIYVIGEKSANFYVLKNGDEYLAIDAGSSKNTAENELKKLHIEPEKITSVLLTHTDFDHIAALSLFKNAAIYLSKEEVQMIDGSTARMFGFGNRLKYGYKTLEDGEEIYFENRKVRPVLTLGHTAGSTSFIVDDIYLFVGDNLSLRNGQVNLFDSLFNMDDSIQQESLKQLAKIQGIKYIFTAHYGFSDNFCEAFEKFR